MLIIHLREKGTIPVPTYYLVRSVVDVESQKITVSGKAGEFATEVKVRQHAFNAIFIACRDFDHIHIAQTPGILNHFTLLLVEDITPIRKANLGAADN